MDLGVVSRSVVVALGVFLAMAGSAARAAPGVADLPTGWLAYGDLRGHIEPCGCDPATDLGGIRRLAIVVERERARDPRIGVFSLGNNLPLAGMHPVKTPFLLRAEALIGPTATLFNALEIQQSPALESFVRSSPAVLKSLKYVLSNATPGSVATQLAASHVDDGVHYVLAYVNSADLRNQVRPLSAAMIGDWRRLVATAKGRRKVLLFSGSDDELRRIASASLFDVIISSNTRPFAVEPGVDERNDERLLRRLDAPLLVHAVPLGGQGVLRGGRLLTEEAKPLADYLIPKDSSTQLPAPGSGRSCRSLLGVVATCADRGDLLPFGNVKRVSWLTPDIGESDPMKALYAEYDAAVKAAFKSTSETRLRDLAASPYAGAQVCAGCHAEANKVYQTTKHAMAMQTLVDKGKQEDGECVACHALVGDRKGGFVSLQASPHLANVQCETCHGPRKAHSQDPLKAPKPDVKPREVCVTCHNRQHSPGYDPVTYWRRIQHK